MKTKFILLMAICVVSLSALSQDTRSMRFLVDVSSVDWGQNNTAIAGTLESGSLAVGDEIKILSNQKIVVIEEILINPYEDPRQVANISANVEKVQLKVINKLPVSESEYSRLAGVTPPSTQTVPQEVVDRALQSPVEIQRGDYLVSISGNSVVKQASKVTVSLNLRSKNEGGSKYPLFADGKFSIALGNSDSGARLLLDSKTEMLHPGKSYDGISIKLISPIPVKKGDRFTLKGSGRVLGTGTVTGY